MDLTLTDKELALLDALDRNAPDAAENIYKNGRRLYDFGLVAPCSQTFMRLTGPGKNALLRARCLKSLLRKLDGEYVAMGAEENSWLLTNRFLNERDEVSSHGKLWVESVRQTRPSGAPT